MSIALYSPVFYENYLNEFINYYTNIGVDLFIFYIDDDIEKYSYLENNKENIILIPQDNEIINTHFFRYCLKILLDKKIDYILRIDCDEFLYINKFKNLKELILFYSPFDCLKINWLMFSSNKILKNNTNSIINTYLYSQQYLHTCTKSLTKVSAIIDISGVSDFYVNSHILPLKENSIYKNILNEISDNNIDTLINFNPFESNLIFIAHYSNQDLYTFLKKKFSSKVFYYWGIISESVNYDLTYKKCKILDLIEKINSNFDDFYKYISSIYLNIENNYELTSLNKLFAIEDFNYEKCICDYFDALDFNKIFNNKIFIYNKIYIYNKMINWVNKKTINLEKINEKIKNCIETKHFTNNGVNVVNIKDKIKNYFEIDEDKDVFMVCNGAMGLNALGLCYNMIYNKKLKWAVQSFTFPCSNQGVFDESIIFDIDENMGPDIHKLNLFLNNYDGIIVTNCFGTCSNIKLYEDFCKKNSKLLLFDNAASPYSIYNNKNHLNYGDGCMVSLHHTKPIGFGEGGFIIINKKLSVVMEKVICFGYTNIDKYNYSKYANNFKMSEIACIYIDSYLDNFNYIKEHHIKLIKYFSDIIENSDIKNKIKLFPNFTDYNKCILSTIPILFDFDIDLNTFHFNKIEAKKYYYPLDKSIKSNEIFNKIICLPLNLDINENHIDYYIEIINKIIN